MVRHLKTVGYFHRLDRLRVPSLGRQLCSRLWLHQRYLDLTCHHALHHLQPVRAILHQEGSNFSHHRQPFDRHRPLGHSGGCLLRNPWRNL